MIEVGEWIRKKSGTINKITKIVPFYENEKLIYDRGTGYLDNKQSGYIVWQLEDYITKHSKNIIDLIEVGDYVNGKEIEEIVNMDITGHGIIERILFYDLDFPIDRDLRCFHDYNIKSIVTKEQFANMEYRLED